MQESCILPTLRGPSLEPTCRERFGNPCNCGAPSMRQYRFYIYIYRYIYHAGELYITDASGACLRTHLQRTIWDSLQLRMREYKVYHVGGLYSGRLRGLPWNTCLERFGNPCNWAPLRCASTRYIGGLHYVDAKHLLESRLLFLQSDRAAEATETRIRVVLTDC